MRTLTAIGLVLVAVGSSGCAGPPTAELIDWRTIAIVGDDDKAATFVPTHVRLRATGTGLYRKNSEGKYALNCEDFVITGPNGEKSKGMMFRDMTERDFAQSVTLGGKPKSQEEVEVVFALPVHFASRNDLVLTYHDLPSLTLDEAKKKK